MKKICDNKHKPTSVKKIKTLNPKRYLYLILGYYFVLVIIRCSNAASTNKNASSIRNGHNNEHGQENIHETVHSPGGGHHTLVYEDVGKAHGASEGHNHGSNAEHGHEGHIHSNNAEHGHEGGSHDGIHVSTVDFEHVATPFIISAWILCACFAKIGFHVTPKLEHLFPESCLLIVLGIIIGLILFYTSSLTPPLTPTTFFLFMLPPIILDAGYFMPNKMFFNNLGTILLFAVIATVWNTFTIGLSLWGLGTAGVYGVELPLLQTLLFSSLISAVDPVAVLAVFEEIHVNEVLYIVVFGESLLNDAVTVVLYHIFEGFSAMGSDKVTVGEVFKGVASFPVVALGGTAIGIIWGFFIGFTTRFTNHVRIIEPLFVFVMAYLSYLCAEVFHMSGILAITFCGITMKNYVEANISPKSHTTVKYTMKMMSSSAETIIFIFLGVATIHDSHYWSWWFVIATIVFCSVYRVIGVIIFTYLANHYRIHKLGFVDQFVMSYGGLRGAVAFALVLLIEPETVQGDENVRKMFITTTITVVFFTVFAQGMTIKPLVEWLKVKRSDSTKETISERIHGKLMDHVMAGVETLLGQVGHYNIRQRFKKIDKMYIRPYLIREIKGDEPKILETYARLILEDALLNPNNIHKPHGDEHIINGSAILTPSEGNVNNISPEALASLIKSVLVDTMSDANIANIVNRRKSSARMSDYCADPSVDKHTAKNLTPSNIDNILAQPSLRNRRMSYNRHSVNESDIDLATSHNTKSMVNYKVPVHFKRILSDGHHGHHGQRPYLKNGSTYTNPTFNFEYDTDDKAGDARNIGHSQLQQRSSVPASPVSSKHGGPMTSIDETLPWKREASDNNSGGNTNREIRRQSEFPSWVANKDYLCYTSPTTTFLGGLTGQNIRTSVAASDVFRHGQQNESTYAQGEYGSDWLSPPPPVSRRGSTAVPVLIAEEVAHRLNKPDSSTNSGSPGTKKTETITRL